jgi:hypothetical protein
MEMREVILGRHRPGPLLRAQLICPGSFGCSDREASGDLWLLPGAAPATQTIITGQGRPRLTDSCPEALVSGLWKWLGAARQRAAPV